MRGAPSWLWPPRFATSSETAPSENRDLLAIGTAGNGPSRRLLVVAYDAGGALAVGVLGAVRVPPAIVAAPFATTLVQRFRGDRGSPRSTSCDPREPFSPRSSSADGLPVEASTRSPRSCGAGSLVRPFSPPSCPRRAHARRASRRERRVEHREAGNVRGATDRGGCVAWTARCRQACSWRQGSPERRQRVGTALRARRGRARRGRRDRSTRFRLPRPPGTAQYPARC